MPSPVLSHAIFWGAAAVSAVAQVAVLRAALAGRTPGAKATLPAQLRELFWVFLPAAILVVVLGWTWRSLPSKEGATSGTVGVVQEHAFPEAAGVGR